MYRKLHLYDLPVFDMPLDYSRDSNRLAITIPMFTSVWTGYNYYSEKTRFSSETFDDLVVRSGAWSALSILTNTDLGEHGVPVYFHVEDVVYDRVVSILSEYGIPEAWIRPTTFPEFPHADELKKSPTGKKLAIFADDGIDADVCMVWDTDAFVYRHPGDKNFQWYQHYTDGGRLCDVPMVLKLGKSASSYDEYVRLCQRAVGYLPIDESIGEDERMLRSYEIAAYGRVGLSAPLEYNRYRVMCSVFSCPRHVPLFDFLAKYYTISYTDDMLVSMYYCNYMDEPLVSFADMGICFELTDAGFRDLDHSAVVHPWGIDRNAVSRYRPRLLKCIDGRNSMLY